MTTDRTSIEVTDSDGSEMDKPRSMRRIVGAGLMGTSLEAYDLYLYGTAAALVFPKVFFPDFDPVVGLLLSLSTFAVSFIARPLGAVLFGHFGDRMGRKNTLYITLLIMGLATFLIAFLPSYDDIGVLAPAVLVLLRFLQGVGFGGEYTGAVLMITEHAPEGRRGFFAGLNNLGPGIGFILSTGFMLALSAGLDEEAFVSWGWRVPFAVSILLVFVGLYLRRSVAESPVFEKALEMEKTESKILPFVGVFRHYRREILLATGCMLLIFTMFYLFSTFTLSYGTNVLGFSRSTMLLVLMGAIVVDLVAIPFTSMWADKIGRRRMMIIGVVAAIVWQLPMYALIDTRNIALMLLALGVQMFIYVLMLGPSTAYLGELFGARVRYTGMAISYNLAGIIGAAPAPILATWLLDETGTVMSIAAYAIVVALISLACLLLLPETKDNDLTEDRTLTQS